MGTQEQTKEIEENERQHKSSKVVERDGIKKEYENERRNENVDHHGQKRTKMERESKRSNMFFFVWSIRKIKLKHLILT